MPPTMCPPALDMEMTPAPRSCGHKTKAGAPANAIHAGTIQVGFAPRFTRRPVPPRTYAHGMRKRLAERQPAERRDLRILLEPQPGFELPGGAVTNEISCTDGRRANALGASSQPQSNEISRKNPDTALFAISYARR